MLRAIWPSIARLPNRLPPGANITSTGEKSRQTTDSVTNATYRDALLLYLLDTAVPLHVYLPTEDSLVVRCEGYRRTHLLDWFAHLGIRQSSVPRSTAQPVITVVWK